MISDEQYQREKKIKEDGFWIGVKATLFVCIPVIVYILFTLTNK